MDRWTELQAFFRVAEARSMTRAAAEMNLSVSGVSRHLMNLETRLGARLVQRSTRQLSLTSEGETLFAEALELLANWEAAEANVSAKVDKPMTVSPGDGSPNLTRFLRTDKRVLRAGAAGRWVTKGRGRLEGTTRIIRADV